MPPRKSSSPSLRTVGICLGYEVKTAKTGMQYADVQVRDESGKIYRCKMWNWSDGFRQYLYPRKYVLAIEMKREDYQGQEQYVISDVQVDTDKDIRWYDSSYIDTEAELKAYSAMLKDNVSDKSWMAIIAKIMAVNDAELMAGIVDDRMGGNQTGTLIHSIRRVTEMAIAIASTMQRGSYPIDIGYMCYAALVSAVSRGAAYEIGEDGNVGVKEETNFFGVIGLPTMSMPMLWQSDELKAIPMPYKQLMVHGLLSTTTSGTIGGYPAIFSNTLEGRIVYHCVLMDRTGGIMSQYILGTKDCMVAIPELVERLEDRNIKFLVPFRLLALQEPVEQAASDSEPAQSELPESA